MIKKILILFIVSITLFSSEFLLAQSGMKFSEFKKKLSSYFDDELINDVEKLMPQGSSYNIWGWDVGDFSNDGHNDVAFAVRISGEKRKIVQVFLFVDIDGFLINVGTYPYSFVEIPLEVGIVIRDNSCYITKKNEQYNWEIIGYQYRDGNLILRDSYSTKRIFNYTYENSIDYVNLTGKKRFIVTSNNKEEFIAKYQIIPSYPRGRQVYKGFSNEILVDRVENVGVGAYYWNGPSDASFTAKSAYDNDNLYVTVKVFDDLFVSSNCSNCYSDNLEIWFDMNVYQQNQSRFFKVLDKKVDFVNKTDKGIYSIKIYPGDFTETKPYVKEVSSTDDMDSYQKEAVKKIRVSASVYDKYYVIKFKVPWLLFGFDKVPIDENKLTELGITIIYNDIDNEFRPEELSQIASSENFINTNPSTYSSLVLIPDEMWFGESKNIFVEDIMKNLIDSGF
ncbi:MAG: hypothetical protein N2319_06380 [Candidatus Kapabacteria bacterium]|nr:hypothetical protein [Candidatus Kapabacteria bacterium]